VKRLLLAAVLIAACADDPGAPQPVVATIQVTSPIGTLWDVGATIQLTASPRDAQGNPVSGVSLTWTTTDPNVATVSGTGSVQAMGIGATTIRAEANNVAGAIAVQVVNADLAAIGPVASDAFAAALANGTTTAVRNRITAAAAAAITAANQGNLEAIQQFVATIRTEVTAATDPTDRALLASLTLFADHVERLLNL
jgi:uncharacterized protein YjdB